MFTNRENPSFFKGNFYASFFQFWENTPTKQLKILKIFKSPFSHVLETYKNRDQNYEQISTCENEYTRDEMQNNEPKLPSWIPQYLH